jgi:hypothetical protein
LRDPSYPVIPANSRNPLRHGLIQSSRRHLGGVRHTLEILNRHATRPNRHATKLPCSPFVRHREVPRPPKITIKRGRAEKNFAMLFFVFYLFWHVIPNEAQRSEESLSRAPPSICVGRGRELPSYRRIPRIPSNHCMARQACCIFCQSRMNPAILEEGLKP